MPYGRVKYNVKHAWCILQRGSHYPLSPQQSTQTPSQALPPKPTRAGARIASTGGENSEEQVVTGEMKDDKRRKKDLETGKLIDTPT